VTFLLTPGNTLPQAARRNSYFAGGNLVALAREVLAPLLLLLGHAADILALYQVAQRNVLEEIMDLV
jgi:hypothetical protein